MRCPRFIKMKQLKISKKPGISTSETNLHVLKKNNSKKFNGKCTLKNLNFSYTTCMFYDYKEMSSDQ